MKEKNGEHPFGDAGQLILLGVFLIVWIGDSFFLHRSTFLSDYVPLYIRLIILGLTLAAAMYLFRSGHVVVTHEQRPNSVVATGAFRYVRAPFVSGEHPNLPRTDGFYSIAFLPCVTCGDIRFPQLHREL